MVMSVNETFKRVGYSGSDILHKPVIESLRRAIGDQQGLLNPKP